MTDTPHTCRHPLIVGEHPTDDSTSSHDGSDLVLTFNESIALSGTGTITLKNLDGLHGASEISYDLTTASEVSADGPALIINPAANHDAGTNYAVQISNDAVQDLMASPV